MREVALGRTDRQLIRPRTEHLADGLPLGGIVRGRARAVRVDVADLARREPRVVERPPQRARYARTGRLR